MNESHASDYTIRYAALPFLYWGAFCAIVSYCSFYLLSIGLSNAVIGVIIACSGVVSVLFQPMVAGYADRTESISLKYIILIVIVLQILGFAMLFLLHDSPAVVSGIIYGCEICLHQINTPLINALGTETLNQGRKLNYGAARAFGSIGYALIAYILGMITVRRPSSSVLLAAIILLLLLALCTLLFPFEKVRNSANFTSQKAVTGLEFFRSYTRFTGVLVGCIGIYIGHVLINNFTLQIVQSKGGSTAQMGTAQAIASIFELPVMFCFGYMLKKYHAKTWMKISGIFFSLKIIATYLAPDMTVFYGIQFFQLFGWALISVASVFYINSVMRDADKIKGQAYFTMTYTLGTVVGSLIGGALLDAFSASAMLVFGSIVSTVGTVIILIFA
ncbi:MAG: MFS transporter [Blautia sp.]|nr:MFS transporter [Blautia sp.]